MAKIRYQHYVVRKGRGYWLPTPKMKKMGFQNVRCGKDGPQARQLAQEWEDRWQLARRGLGDVPKKIYPKDSVGDLFERFRQTNEWKDKEPRTREDWERGWSMIEPVFADVHPKHIGFEELDHWYGKLRARWGIDKAGRGLKTWRAMYPKIMAVLGSPGCRDPSLELTKHVPPPRDQVWSEGETVRLVKGAIRAGFNGLACIIAVAWDTVFQPGDVRKLIWDNLHENGDEWAFPIKRGKTSKSALGILSKRTKRLVEAYLVSLPFELTPKAPLFYTRGYAPKPGTSGGRPRAPVKYTTNSLNSDFAKVRTLVFGEGEKRMLMDMRRSGVHEADAGGSTREDVSAKMGNNLDESAFLQMTYLGVNVARVRAADESRKVGRRLLATGQNRFKKLKPGPRKS